MSESYAFNPSTPGAGGPSPTLQAESKAQPFREVAEMSWEDAKNKAQEFLTEAEGFVKENPGKAVLTAVGVGFVLGLLFRR